MDKISEESKVALQQIFANTDKLVELQEKEANEILVVSSPIENRNIILRPPPTEIVKK